MLKHIVYKILYTYYYVIAIAVDVRYLPWLFREDTDSKLLKARFIFRIFLYILIK